MEHLNGFLRLSRMTTSDWTYAHLTLQDATSRLHCVEVFLTHEELGKVLMHEQAACTFLMRATHVGTYLEVKREQVPALNWPLKQRAEEEAAACQAFEQEGWRHLSGYYGNRHYRKGTGLSATYEVPFHRYVTTPPAAKEC